MVDIKLDGEIVEENMENFNKTISQPLGQYPLSNVKVWAATTRHLPIMPNTIIRNLQYENFGNYY